MGTPTPTPTQAELSVVQSVQDGVRTTMDETVSSLDGVDGRRRPSTKLLFTKFWHPGMYLGRCCG